MQKYQNKKINKVTKLEERADQESDHKKNESNDQGKSGHTPVSENRVMRPNATEGVNRLIMNHGQQSINLQRSRDSLDIMMKCEECEEEEQIRMKPVTQSLIMAGSDENDDNSNIQTKLTIGSPDDEYEKEADAVADKVMRMPDPAGEKDKRIDAKSGSAVLIQEKCKECEEEDKLQMKPEGGRINQKNGPDRLAANIHRSEGQGSPLPETVQNEMGNKMGADFSRVRVHMDSDAMQMNRQLGAKAFTHGKDIYFNRGEFDITSNKGRQLVAHELVHTIQQGSVSRLQKQKYNTSTISGNTSGKLIQ